MLDPSTRFLGEDVLRKHRVSTGCNPQALGKMGEAFTLSIFTHLQLIKIVTIRKRRDVFGLTCYIPLGCQGWIFVKQLL